jgi:hypothetical protein
MEIADLGQDDTACRHVGDRMPCLRSGANGPYGAGPSVHRAWSPGARRAVEALVRAG